MLFIAVFTHANGKSGKYSVGLKQIKKAPAISRDSGERIFNGSAAA